MVYHNYHIVPYKHATATPELVNFENGLTWKEEQPAEQRGYMRFPFQQQAAEPSETLSKLLGSLLQV